MAVGTPLPPQQQQQVSSTTNTSPLQLPQQHYINLFLLPQVDLQHVQFFC